MKKNLLSLICLVLALALTLCACGKNPSEPSDTAATESDEQAAPAVNAYTASYEDVLGLLVAEGAIAEGAQPTDINTTPGYFFDNMTEALSTDAIAVADTANDYAGVYLVKFDIDGDHVSDWIAMRQNGGILLYMGGMAVLQLDSTKGLFGLGFSGDVSEDVKTKATTAFNKLDATVPEDVKYLTSTDELAVALKNKGYLQTAELAGENLNEKYYVEGPGEDWDEVAEDYVAVDDYKYYAEFGSGAKTYGGITIFYFELFNDYLFGADTIDSSGVGLAYKSMQTNGAVTGYVSDQDWNYTPYTENGSELSIPVDVVVGRFAVSIDDSVANKAEIIEWLKSLEK